MEEESNECPKMEAWTDAAVQQHELMRKCAKTPMNARCSHQVARQAFEGQQPAESSNLSSHARSSLFQLQ